MCAAIKAFNVYFVISSLMFTLYLKDIQLGTIDHPQQTSLQVENIVMGYFENLLNSRQLRRKFI